MNDFISRKKLAEFFRRIKPVHWFFFNDTIYCQNKKEARNIVQFLVKLKNTKTYQIVFLTRGKKEREKAKIYILSSKRQNNRRAGAGAKKGSIGQGQNCKKQVWYSLEDI